MSGGGFADTVQALNNSGTLAGLASSFGALGYNAGAGLQNRGIGAAISSMGPAFMEGQASGIAANEQAQEFAQKRHQRDLFNAMTGDEGAIGKLSAGEQDQVKALQ